jgi:hypothetical protein
MAPNLTLSLSPPPSFVCHTKEVKSHLSLYFGFKNFCGKYFYQQPINHTGCRKKHKTRKVIFKK